MGYRLGVDVGGTFTDILLIDESSGGTWRAKTAETPQNQSVGVLRGIQRACEEAGISLAEVGEVLHGTTVATNAILEGKGARVGLVTTKGFRQVLHIARSFVPRGLAGWIIWPKPEPLAALENTVEAIERVGSDGSVVTALDEDAVRAQLRRLRGNDIEALAVCLINLFANPDHEQAIGRVGRYVAKLAEQLGRNGVDAALSILRSDGGLASALRCRHLCLGAGCHARPELSGNEDPAAPGFRRRQDPVLHRLHL